MVAVVEGPAAARLAELLRELAAGAELMAITQAITAAVAAVVETTVALEVTATKALSSSVTNTNNGKHRQQLAQLLIKWISQLL